MLIQQSVKKILNIFEEAVISAVIDELQNLHSREALEPKLEMSLQLKKERMLCEILDVSETKELSSINSDDRTNLAM